MSQPPRPQPPKPQPPKQQPSPERYRKPTPIERSEIGLTPESARELAQTAVENVIFASKHPRIPAGLISNVAFGSTRIDLASHEHFITAVKEDPRIVHIGKAEYEIIDDTRDLIINQALVDGALEHVIEILKECSEVQRFRQNEIASLLRVSQYFLISEELAIFFENLNQHPNIKLAENGRYFFKSRIPRNHTRQNLGSRATQQSN